MRRLPTTILILLATGTASAGLFEPITRDVQATAHAMGETDAQAVLGFTEFGGVNLWAKAGGWDWSAGYAIGARSRARTFTRLKPNELRVDMRTHVNRAWTGAWGAISEVSMTFEVTEAREVSVDWAFDLFAGPGDVVLTHEDGRVFWDCACDDLTNPNWQLDSGVDLVSLEPGTYELAGYQWASGAAGSTPRGWLTWAVVVPEPGCIWMLLLLAPLACRQKR